MSQVKQMKIMMEEQQLQVSSFLKLFPVSHVETNRVQVIHKYRLMDFTLPNNQLEECIGRMPSILGMEVHLIALAVMTTDASRVISFLVKQDDK